MRTLSENQKSLARHALGLPNEKMVSYRNRFVAAAGSGDYYAWERMVLNKFATRYETSMIPDGYCYVLNLEGAYSALEKGEKLDKEDFSNKADGE